MSKKTEAYRADDDVVVVHRRAGGEVYGHTQGFHDEIVLFKNYFLVSNEKFESTIAERGAEPFDVAELPYNTA